MALGMQCAGKEQARQTSERGEKRKEILVVGREKVKKERRKGKLG